MPQQNYFLANTETLVHYTLIDIMKNKTCFVKPSCVRTERRRPQVKHYCNTLFITVVFALKCTRAPRQPQHRHQLWRMLYLEPLRTKEYRLVSHKGKIQTINVIFVFLNLEYKQ